MTANTNVLYFRRHIKIPRPMLLNRAEIQKTIPRIDGMLGELRAHARYDGLPLPAAVCTAIDTDCIRTLLEKQWDYQRIDHQLVTYDTLLMYLPYEFESSLSQWAVSSASPFCRANRVALRNRIYVCWRCTSSDQQLVSELRIPFEDLSLITTASFAKTKLDTSWIPVVMLAGNTIAIGGFTVDIPFFDQLEAITEACLHSGFLDTLEQEKKDGIHFLDVYFSEAIPFFWED